MCIKAPYIFVISVYSIMCYTGLLNSEIFNDTRARGRGFVVACALPSPISRDRVRLSTIRYMSDSHNVARAVAGWFLRSFLSVFRRNKARNGVKWTISRHISEITLSTMLNPNQTNKQTI